LIDQQRALEVQWS